jgi:DNA-binding IclR family transcriptional regulator
LKTPQGEVTVLGRIGEIIGLFSEDRPSITLEMVQQHLGASGATTYRYLTGLTELGLLSRYSGRYWIGPKVMELEYLMQNYDPILVPAADVMRNLASKIRCHVLLCRVFGSQIVQVFHARSPSAPDLNFVPGRKLPLFRGSQSRIILAFLERRRLMRIFKQHEGDRDRDRVGAEWKAFSKALARNRKDGYYVSREELDVGTIGIAAPVFDSNEEILGSLVVAYRLENPPALGEAEMISMVVSTAKHISTLNNASAAD